jgi:ribulose 1,5-bisphosphate synthetase/thiazole synthase
MIANKYASWHKARHAYAKWQRPAHFDRNLIVIGGGAAGLVAAYIVAAVKPEDLDRSTRWAATA